ncbi:MAG TPA: ATP-binding protein [Candidatus Omnitrophota bacterium]|nr:ATP-binding protein [Candidatus Omnitrophota bacterium]
MFEKIPSALTSWLFSKGWKGFYARGLFLFFAISPVLVLAAFSYLKTFEQLTRFEISQKEFLAKLSAVTVSEKISNFIDIGTSLAMNPLVVDAVTLGDQKKARVALTGLPTLFPFIERIFISNPQGTVIGDYPGVAGIAGTSRANREWYKGVIKTMRPFVTEVYQTWSEPKYNVIAIAIPILPPGSGVAAGQEEREALKNMQGILTLQIKLDPFELILKPMERNTEQIAYLVDQSGHIVYHPRFPFTKGIVDFSGLPIMNALLKGKNGAEVIFNPVEKLNELVAYEPIPKFGWGVVVTQPVQKVFKDRDKALREVLLFYGILLAFSILLVNLFLRFLQIRIEGEEKLQNSYNLLQAIVDGTSEMVSVKDYRGRYIMINSVGERWFGKSRSEIIGKLDIEILSEADARQFKDNDLKAMVGGGKLYESEETLDVHGKSLILHTVRAPHRDYAGKILGVIGVARDITERKSVERRNRELVEAKAQFVSMVTHELRTPLTAIKEGVGIVLDGVFGDVNEQQKKFLEIGRRNTERLHRLINSVLDFQKLESGKMVFTPEENDLQSVIREVYETMKLVIEQKGLKFELDLDDKMPHLRFDRDKIVQVLINLLNNAVKFTDHGSIVIRLHQEDVMAHVSVSDTGPGISADDIPKLFQSFQQLDNVKEKKTGGSGLGLAICKEIIIRHQGKIWAESKLGEGTTMHFILPIKERRQFPNR